VIVELPDGRLADEATGEVVGIADRSGWSPDEALPVPEAVA
jgi:hypothetical protein